MFKVIPKNIIGNFNKGLWYMEKGISRTNFNVYNKMDKDTRIFMPKPLFDGKSSYINAKKLAISEYEVSDEIKDMNFMDILKKAANKKNS